MRSIKDCLRSKTLLRFSILYCWTEEGFRRNSNYHAYFQPKFMCFYDVSVMLLRKTTTGLDQWVLAAYWLVRLKWLKLNMVYLWEKIETNELVVVDGILLWLIPNIYLLVLVRLQVDFSFGKKKKNTKFITNKHRILCQGPWAFPIQTLYVKDPPLCRNQRCFLCSLLHALSISCSMYWHLLVTTTLLFIIFDNFDLNIQ